MVNFQNVSRSKDNQTINLCQLLEYNKIDIFVQILSTKLARDTSPRPLFAF